MSKLRLSIIGCICMAAIGYIAFINYKPYSLLLDQEVNVDDRVLTPDTQSLNRYESKLRQLEKFNVDYDQSRNRFSVYLIDKKGNRDVYLKNLNPMHYVPLLPYNNSRNLDDFDKFNLYFSEHSRTGTSISCQSNNTLFGYFNATDNFFDSNGEYLVKNGSIQANPNVQPKRLGIYNSCLSSGLWELKGTDSVGTMYHSWLSFPKDIYLTMIRSVNNISISDNHLLKIIDRKKPIINEPVLKLEKLRLRVKKLETTTLVINQDKLIDSYSNQEGRRKVQNKFFRILRNGKQIYPITHGDLEQGDVFSFNAFTSPGVYSELNRVSVTYNPGWENVEIFKTQPLTRYPEQSEMPTVNQQGTIEIVVYSEDKQQGLILGNLPVSLLVYQEEFKIPALGVGVLPEGELMERRYLRFKEGPLPTFAYLFKTDKDLFLGLNHLKQCIEQLYIRPYKLVNNQVVLRVTLVASQRIVDLLEFDIPITNAEVLENIESASKHYQQPLYRTYKDSNFL